MKKVQHYICEICGTEYNDESVCTKCEKGHRAAKCISGSRYLSMSQDKSGYPLTIDIMMDDGKTIRYKR